MHVLKLGPGGEGLGVAGGGTMPDSLESMHDAAA